MCQVNAWDRIAGVPDYGFISDICNEQFGGLNPRDYFASFVQGTYNQSLYGTSSYSSLHYKMVNPCSSLQEIDLIHMFASFDGIASGTGAAVTTFPYNQIMKTWQYKYLISWAGDLQCAAAIAGNNNLTNFTFEYILSNSAYMFDYSDFYADIDAMNLGAICYLNTTNYSISDYFSNYYNGLSSNSINRFQDFVSKATSLSNVTGTTSEKLYKIVYDMLSLDENGNHKEGTTDNKKLKFHFMMCYYTGTGSLPNASIRKQVGDSFCDYLLNN